MNNKKLLWQLNDSPGLCVWVCVCVCVCVCVSVCQGLSRTFGLGCLVTESTFWRNERVVSCCQNATKRRIFYKKKERALAALLCFSVRISGAAVGCQHGSRPLASLCQDVDVTNKQKGSLGLFPHSHLSVNVCTSVYECVCVRCLLPCGLSPHWDICHAEPRHQQLTFPEAQAPSA